MNAQGVKRKTIAVLVDYLDLFAGAYETEFRVLFEGMCESLGFNLMFVYGRKVADPDPGYAAHNRIYELLGPQRVDGLIALSSSLLDFCTIEGAAAFFKRYESLARCSIGLAVPAVPSLEIDNRAGMTALVEHLIEHHQYRRLAFICGPEQNAEAKVRFEAYKDALERHGIPFDPELVEQGTFARRTGTLAVGRLLARAGKPHAVIAANDNMALGAITGLRAVGLRVPEDIAVTGFDDLMVARLGDPPLTTVAQPVRALAEGAVALVLRQMAGEVVPQTTSLATRFVARESCGCQQNAPSARHQGASERRTGSRERISARAAELIRTWGRGGEAGHFGEETGRDQGEGGTAGSGQEADGSSPDSLRLLSALEREFDGTRPGGFLEELTGRLAALGSGNEEYQNLQVAISRLRREFSEVATPELEDLWHQARSVIALTNTRRQEQLRQEHDQAYYRLIDNNERFAAALDLPTLKSALSGALLTLGMNHTCVSHYTDAAQRYLECFVAIRDGVACEPENPRFPAEELMPQSSYPESRRSTFLVFPLAFDGKNLGVAVFESRPGVNGYQIVRDQISAVLRSIELHQEILQRFQEQEREATAKRIQSLSILAGGVAHDLNNVLGPLVALPDMILEQWDRLVPADIDEADLRDDIASIKVAALRATQTIKDLLTLGRQGRMAKESLELNELVARCLSVGELPVSRESGRVSLELCSERVFVLASEAHLTRAVNNLVRNALEATDQRGKVVIQTGAVVLREPTPGYETIDPGDYALIRVSDTGRGISPQQIGRVFEPFFSSKRLSEHSGSGLGLAIVHGVIKEHGGFVNIESAVGRGTTFTLYLPRGVETQAFAAVLAEAPRGAARILVVDDEPIQLRTCRRVLTALGYRVDLSSSGKDAYRIFLEAAQSVPPAGKSPYDLVILDMLLNEEDDGLTVYHRICGLFPGQRGIVASGHAPSERAELAVEHGLTWLAKPYTRATLAHAVHTTITAPRPREATKQSIRCPRPSRPPPSAAVELFSRKV